MRPVLLASPWLVVLVACDFNDAPPVLEQLELACDADGLDLHLIANDVEQVTNVVVTVEHERADSGDTGSLPLTVYPDRLHGETEGGLSAWEAEDLELDCDETWLFELELTNLWGLQTVEQAAWPVPEPEGAELDPPFGSEIGGTEVTIAGDDLALVDEVTFDGSQATIVSTSASEVVVTTPAHGPGEVDVTLSGAGAETTLPAAFEYFEDATGRIRGIHLADFYVYEPTHLSIGSPYGTVTYGPFLQLQLVFHDAVDVEQTYLGGYLPAADGSCSYRETFESDFEDVGTYLLMGDAVAGDLPLGRTDGNVYWYLEDEVAPLDYYGRAFDVEVVDGAGFIPPMTLHELIVWPDLPVDASWDWSDPGDMVSGDDFALTWDGAASPFSGLSYELYVNSGASTTLSSVTCTVDATTGELTVPWDELTAGVDLDAFDSLYVRLEFQQDTYVPMHDGSEFWGRGNLVQWLYMPVVAAPEDTGLDTADSGAP